MSCSISAASSGWPCDLAVGFDVDAKLARSRCDELAAVHLRDEHAREAPEHLARVRGQRVEVVQVGECDGCPCPEPAAAPPARERTLLEPQPSSSSSALGSASTASGATCDPGDLGGAHGGHRRVVLRLVGDFAGVADFSRPPMRCASPAFPDRPTGARRPRRGRTARNAAPSSGARREVGFDRPQLLDTGTRHGSEE